MQTTSKIFCSSKPN